MAQGALGAAGVRRVGYGQEVGRSVRAGRGHIVSPRAQLVLKKFVEAELYKKKISHVIHHFLMSVCFSRILDAVFHIQPQIS